MANLTFRLMDATFDDWERVLDLNKKAFPKEERMEDKFFKQLVSWGAQAYAIYDEDFVGFVIGSYSEQYKIFYIWFLAVDPSLQSHGYGTKILNQLDAVYPDTQWVLEIEELDKPCDNHEERMRRYAFYQRNHFERTIWGVSYFGASFEIICKNGPFRKEDYEAFWNSLWHDRKAPDIYVLK